MKGFNRLSDNQAFSRRPFTSRYWWGAGANPEHFVQTRGRLACFCDELQYRIDDTLSGAVVHAFRPSPLETLYEVQLTLATAQTDRDVRLRWGVATETTGGLQPSDAQNRDEVMVGPGSGWEPIRMIEIYARIIEPYRRFFTGVLQHRINPSLPAGIRKLLISWEWPDGMPDQIVQIYGIMAVGYATDEDV